MPLVSNPDDIKGWTMPDGWSSVDLSEEDFGHAWVWRANEDSITGRYTFEQGHTYSLSPENGFLCLPMDEYNFVDYISTTNHGNCYLELPPIDCSDFPDVIFSMQQFFRFNGYSNYKKLMITTDDGVHWAEYLLRFETPTHEFCFQPNVEINISDIAGGQSNVIMRIHWTAGSRYFMAIDDIRLSEAYHHDLIIENQWAWFDNSSDDNEEGFYSMLPLNQIGNNNFGAYDFKAAMLTMGIEDPQGAHLNVEILKNGTSVYNENSSIRNITAHRDTFYIEQQFLPDDYGDYEFTFSAVQNNDDQRPSNNSTKMMVTVNDSIFARDDWTQESHSGTHNTGNDDGDVLGISYLIDQPCEASSISVFITNRYRNPDASTKPGYQYKFSIWYIDDDDGFPYELIATEMYDVQEEDLNTWITQAFEKDGENEFLEPGEYFACIEMWTGGGIDFNNNEYRFTIGEDMTTYLADNKAVSIDNYEDVFYINDLAMIRLNLNYTDGPSVAPVTFNVDMNVQIAMANFNPSSDFVDISGSFNDWGGSEQLTDDNGDGIYTLTVQDLTYLDEIEYKYRINANEASSEFPSGGPNHKHLVRYWNVTDDLYNDDAVVGIEKMTNLTSDFVVYPNPANDVLNISGNNKFDSELRIIMTNLQGQVVYDNVIKSPGRYNEKVDVGNFPRGIYFLRVNNSIEKLIIK